MIDKDKYLYWLNPNDENFTKEVMVREMYSRFGCIFHLVQSVEYNLANIISIEKYEIEKGKPFTPDKIHEIQALIEKEYSALLTMTFGQLSKKIKSSKYLSKYDLKKIEKFVNYRNYLAHMCFKERFISNKLDDIDIVDDFVDDLNAFEIEVSEFNDFLAGIFGKINIIPQFLYN